MTENLENKILKKLSGKETTEKPIYIASFEDLVDLVENDGEVKFLTFDGELYSSREIDGRTYNPPKIESLAFSLPNYHEVKKYYDRHDVTGVSGDSGVTGGVCKEDLNLFDALNDYHIESSELPKDNLYQLITAWDFHNHFIEKFQFSPIILFLGLPEKGKSRMARSMIYVSKRGLIKASVTDAQLIREAKDHEATIFFDMKDFWKSMERSGSEDIILSRFERGLKVARVKWPEKGAFEDMVYYNVFGSTIVASNEVVDQILGTRAVTIIMRQSKKEFKKNVCESRGCDLRNQLVAWRWAHFNDPLPEPEKIVPGRFGDIFKTLHQIIVKVSPKYEENFKELVKELEQQKMAGKSDTLEGDIIQTILSLEGAVGNGILAVKIIVDEVNKNRSEREKVTYQAGGRKLNVMGYQKAKTSNGSSAIRWNESLNEALADEYNVAGVEIENVTRPETPETPVTPVSNSNNSKEEDIDIDKLPF